MSSCLTLADIFPSLLVPVEPFVDQEVNILDDVVLNSSHRARISSGVFKSLHALPLMGLLIV